MLDKNHLCWKRVSSEPISTQTLKQINVHVHIKMLLCIFYSRCDFGLKVLWSAKLRDSPLTATPLLFDVDGDGYNDIVVPSFSGEVWSVHGESGHIIDNWPFYLEDRAFHASPLVVRVCVCVCVCVCVNRKLN